MQCLVAEMLPARQSHLRQRSKLGITHKPCCQCRRLVCSIHEVESRQQLTGSYI
jgi:hypothetical protein